jgi:large subunit ribosomal protein L22
MSKLQHKKEKQLTKKQRKAANIDNSSKAVLKFVRLSPIKANLIAREVQGMNAEEAIAALEFTPNKGANIISKVIASAVANSGQEADEVIVSSVRVDQGPVLRRFIPRARGSATKIRKPTSHIVVEVSKAKDN